jgi:glycosyltransferase involved in cell wall biosynthesis
MNNGQLSICIPTFNRVAYLRELLPILVREVAAANAAGPRVELVISNNASTDETEAYIRTLSCPALVYNRNPENIGGDRNLLRCVEHANNRYVWLLGDDELVAVGGIAQILHCLDEAQPALLVLRAANRVEGSCDWTVYPNYGACLRAQEHAASFALGHTLISANLFCREVFDLPFGRAMLPTCYAHMYGLAGSLRQGGKVAVMDGVLRVRPQRAQFAHWPMALCVKQAMYLWRVAGWFHVPALRPFAFRLALNLPIEILARILSRFSRRFGRV